MTACAKKEKAAPKDDAPVAAAAGSAAPATVDGPAPAAAPSASKDWITQGGDGHQQNAVDFEGMEEDDFGELGEEEEQVPAEAPPAPVEAAPAPVEAAPAAAQSAGTRLYVGNLSFNTTGDTIREEFSALGEVIDVHVVMDRESGQPRGFAFVTMGSPAEAEKAINEMNGKMIDGRPLRVNEAEERAPRGGGGGRGGGGFGGGGGGRGGGRGGGDSRF